MEFIYYLVLEFMFDLKVNLGSKFFLSHHKERLLSFKKMYNISVLLLNIMSTSHFLVTIFQGGYKMLCLGTANFTSFT